eukprot:1149243-Pelagomonas_calceolata.AAC.2
MSGRVLAQHTNAFPGDTAWRCLTSPPSWGPGLLPGWNSAASYFITSHTAEYLMARSDQESIGVAGVASSLIRNAGVKEVGRYSAIRDMLSDVQVMLSQTICAAYIHMYKV